MTTAFKAPLWGNVPPPALPPPATGNPKIDEAIAVMQTGSIFDKKVESTARKLDPEVLLAMLDDRTVDIGESYWDDDKIKKLGIGDKRAQKKIYEQTTDAINGRVAWVNWLFHAVASTKRGAARLIEIAGSAKYRPYARSLAAAAFLEAKPDDAMLRAAASAIDPTTWDGGGGREVNRLEHAYATGVYAALRTDPNGALRRYAPLLDAKKVKTPEDDARATAVLFALKMAGDRGVKPEELAHWSSAVVGLLPRGGMLEHQVYFALKVLPPDPASLEPLLQVLLPNPKKPPKYFTKSALEALARVADTRALPCFVAALQASWMNFEVAFAGFEKAGDPSMIPVIEAWLEKNGDEPSGERMKHGKRVIAALKKRPPVAAAAGAATPAARLFEEKKPARKRPTYAFVKGPKPEERKIESLATQEAHVTKLFADAKLGTLQKKLVKYGAIVVPSRADEKKIAVGASKLGGHPDLPKDTKWPRSKNKTPLTFLAQIDVKEAAAHLPAGALGVKDGLLSFFVIDDFEGEEYLDQAVVLHTKPKTALVRHEVPEDFFAKIYQACTVAFHPMLAVPHGTDWHLKAALKAGPGREKYEEHVFFARDPETQLLGYRTHEYEESIKKGETLLIQFPGDMQTDMEFGDAEVLNVFIDEKRLAKGDFSKVRAYVGD